MYIYEGLRTDRQRTMNKKNCYLPDPDNPGSISKNLYRSLISKKD